ncbi:MAG: hypothetical protein F6K55_04780 [Moorea sp. SIO4A3]|nr:hypothetical protein [Moorena sp. SIO4A3]
MRYTEFFPNSEFTVLMQPIAIPCSLFPVPRSAVPFQPKYYLLNYTSLAIAFLGLMRYTELFDYWLLPLLYYLLPAPCSLLPKTQIFVPHKS